MVVETLLQEGRKEGAEHVAADGLRGCDDRLAIKGILLGRRLVALDNVAPTLDSYLLGKSLGLSARALDWQRHQRIFVLEHDSFGNRIGAFACTKD